MIFLMKQFKQKEKYSMKNTNQFAFKEITENPIKLDFSKCKTLSDVYSLLKNKFGFHNFYGANWDALWDLMQDVFSDDEEYLVEIYNFSRMHNALRTSCEKMLEIFEDLHNINPDFKYTTIC